MARLLSLLGALLTLLTAAAVLALVATPPPVPPAEEAPAPGAIAPAAGGNAAGGNAANSDATGGGGLAGLAPALLDLAAGPRLAWARALAAQIRPSGFALEDTRLSLGETALGDDLVVVFERLRVRPTAAGWDADFAGRLVGAPAVTFAGTGRLRAREAGQRLHVVFERVTLGALARRLAPDRIVAAEVTVAGTLDARLAAGALAGPVRATARLVAPGRVRAAGMPAPLAVSMLETALTVAPAGDAVTIDRLALASPAFELAGRGTIAPERTRLALAFDAIEAAMAGELWPAGVADGARDWITANITAGRIARLDLLVDLDAAALEADVLPTDAIRGEARIADAEIHYLRPMPPAEGVDATARFDGDGLTFDVAGGTAGAVTVTGGTIVVTDYADPATIERLDVDLDGRGTVPAMLALTDHEPLTLATRKGLPVADAGGAGTFRLRVGLPLLSDLALEEVDLRFTGDFGGVRLPGMAAGRDLTDAEVELEATADTVDAEGRGRIGGVPLDLGYRVAGEGETLTARGRIDAARLSELGAPPLPARGEVGLQAVLTTRGDRERSELRLDVTDAEIELPALAVWKPAGIAGRIAADIVERAGAVDVERLEVRWPGVDVVGSARLDADGRLVALRLAPLVVAGTELRVSGERRDGTLRLQVTGARLDVAPLLHGERSGGDAGGGDVASLPPAVLPLALDVAIDEVVGGGDGALTAVVGEIRADGRRLGPVRLDAGIRPGGGKMSLRLEAATGGDRLTLTSDDAGGLADALGVSDAVDGGTLDLAGTLLQAEDGMRFDGDVGLRDVVLAGAPAVVRVLAAAPPTADLADDALAVSRFTSPIAYADGVLTLEDAVLIASNLAMRVRGEVDVAADRLDLTGSLAPLQAVNRFIGNLPVIGDLLQGSRKAGAFAVSFSVEGPRADPRVDVNPLSVVTPGVLEDLFAGVEVSPPRIPDERD